MKLITIGTPKSGKTAIYQRYAENTFTNKYFKVIKQIINLDNRNRLQNPNLNNKRRTLQSQPLGHHRPTKTKRHERTILQTHPRSPSSLRPHQHPILPIPIRQCSQNILNSSHQMWHSPNRHQM